MTLEEARTIWLTLLGSDWVTRYDVMMDSQYHDVIRPAYKLLNDTASMDVDLARDMVKIKCKS